MIQSSVGKHYFIYFNPFSTESLLSSRNIRHDGASKLALRMIRAACFFNFDNRWMFAIDVVPDVMEP